MSTLNEREAMLRGALHAAADAIEPRADGLQRIQARLRPPRPVALAWAEGVWTDARMRVPAVLQAWLEWLREFVGVAWERFGPRSGTSGRRAARTLGWLRPAAALGVTVSIVAAGAYVAISAQQAIFPSSSNSLHSTGGGAGTGGSHGGSGGTSAQSPSALGSLGATGSKTSSPICRQTKPAGAPRPSPSTSTSQSTSPSTSPSASPSSSDTGSSSPTPTVSPAGPSTTGPSTAGSASPAAAALANSAVLARSLAASPTPSTCVKKKRSGQRSPAGPTPHVTPAVIGFGKLDDGG